MERTWLEGQIAVEAAIRGGNRIVEKVYLRQGKWDSGIRRLMKTAEEGLIPVERAEEKFFDSHAVGQTHGGVLAEVGPRRFMELPALLSGKAKPLIVMLDGLEDPYNFGQAVRALYAAGASGLVVRKRNWFSAAGVVARASAGTSELIPTVMVDTTLEAAEFYRKNGLLIACTAKDSAVSIYDTDLTIPLFLVIGGEKRGITRSFMDQADLLLQIPYGRPFSNSLGTVSSTALIVFEAMRQRNVAGL